jgi:hypothetical protein
MYFIKKWVMLLNHQDSLKNYNRLFHISEEPGISIFDPRPSPSFFESITGDVVYAISGKLLHNYLLPRDCPRITYYVKDTTTDEDKEKFFGESTADNIIIVESGWYHRIAKTTLYCYEFSADNFTLLDECAQYYISCKPEKPLKVSTITDIMAELLNLNIELRFTPSLIKISDDVVKSSLNFSIIRMRNAKV